MSLLGNWAAVVLPPEAEPEELELLLLLDVAAAAAPFALLLAEPPRVTSGETGEPRSSSLKSGLFLSLSFDVRESKPVCSFFECDIVVNPLGKTCSFCYIKKKKIRKNKEFANGT